MALQSAGGVGRIPEVIRALVQREQVKELVVAQDVNHGPSALVIQSIQAVVSIALGGVSVEMLTPTGESFRVRDVIVGVIPMGLPEESYLRELGVTSHSMEDYLIKLVLEDESLRPTVPRFKELVVELIGTMRKYDVLLNSSKELFQLVKPIVKHGFSDTGVVHALFQRAEPAILRRVMDPLLDQVERAASV